MHPAEKTRLLKQSLLFSALDEEELAKLADLATECHFPAGETIFWEGDPSDRFYIVGQGRVKVVKHASSGKELIVAIFTPGHTFGEVAAFDGKPYPASAHALEEVTIMGIKRDAFLNFLVQNPLVSLKMINMLGGRLRDAHDRLRDMAGEKVEQRIANMLLMLSSKLGSTIPFTRQEIADMVGTTTETAIRAISRLKEQGIVTSSRGKIIILDESKLHLLSQGSSLV